MSDIVLSPYNRETAYTTRYRPVRIAFLIPSNDKQLFLKSIRINSSLWGGYLNVVVPYEKIIKKDKNEFWYKTLEIFKPDNIVVPDSCTAELMEELKLLFDAFHIVTFGEWFARQGPLTTHFGVQIYSFFEQEKFFDNKEKRKKAIFFNFSDEEHYKDFRYAVTFGSLLQDKTPQIKSPYLRTNLPYDTFVDLKEFKLDAISDEDYVRQLIENTEHKALTFWEYTLVSGERFRCRLSSKLHNVNNRFPVIVLTKGGLQDYMLAAVLRIKFMNNLLNQPAILDISRPVVNKEISSLLQYLKEKNYVACNVVSLTCSEEEIRDFIQTNGIQGRHISKEELLHDFSSKLIFCYDVRSICTLQKRLTLLLRKPQFFNNLESDDSYFAEIEFENYELPYKPVLNSRFYRDQRVGKDGIKILMSGGDEKKLSLMIPDADDILYTLMVNKKIRPVDTPVRRKMKAIASYFDNFWDISIFSTKELQQLFFELKSPLLDEFRIRYARFGDICKLIRGVNPAKPFSGDLIKYFVLILIEKKILFRGAEISCPNCHLKQWKPLDTIKNEDICSGCGGAIKFVDISVTHWTYRLNQLFSESFDTTVFLTLMCLVGYKYQDLDKVVGYNFGFKAEIADDSLVQKLNGKKEVEFDFSVIANGEITIGECKQNPDDFTDEVINNSIEFARFIGVDRLIFSSIGKLNSLREKMNALDKHELQIKVLDETDLCYLSAHLYEELRREARHKDGKDLKDVEKRRDAFIEQYKHISEFNTRSPDAKVIGDYFSL